MPLPGRGGTPKYNPNIQRLRDIDAVTNYQNTLERINEEARARGGYEYWDENPLDEINYEPPLDTLIKPDDYYLPHPLTEEPIFQGAKRGGSGGSGGGDKRSSGSNPFGGARSGAAGTKKRFTVTTEVL
jgi:uncharacterized membrane protein YgcG